MIYTNARFSNADHTGINVEFNGKFLSVPVDDSNRHCREIFEAAAAGTLSIADFGYDDIGNVVSGVRITRLQNEQRRRIRELMTLEEIIEAVARPAMRARIKKINNKATALEGGEIPIDIENDKHWS